METWYVYANDKYIGKLETTLDMLKETFPYCTVYTQGRTIDVWHYKA